MQTADLARSNIQRPYMRFDMKRASGRQPLDIKSVAKSYDDLVVIPRFSASVSRGEKIALTGRNGAGKTTLIKSLIRNATGYIEDSDREFPIDGGSVVWGHEVAVSVISRRTIRIPSPRAAPLIDWLQQYDPAGDAGGTARLAGPHAVQRGRRAETYGCALRRRGGHG